MAQQRTLTVALKAAVQGYTRPVQQAAAATGTLEASIQKTQRTGMAMSRVGDSMTRGVTLPLVGLGVMAARAAGNFESSMNQVRAVSGATGEEFQAMSDLAREMGSTTAFSASEAADAMGFLAQAGFDAEETMEALPAVLNLAAAGGMDLATSADIASNVLSGFNLEVDQLGRVVDVMALAMTSTNVNMEMLGETFQYVGPLAAAAGLEFEEVAAAAGLLGNAGIQASQAGTALRGSLARLLDPTPEVTSTLEDLGVAVMDSSGDMLPLVDIMRQLEDAGASTADMMKIFGTEAGPAMQSLLAQGSDELENLTSELEDAGGTAEVLAAVQMEGLNGAIKELTSAFEGFLIDVGSVLAPILKDLAGILATVARGFGALPEPVQRTAVMLGLVAAAAGPIMSIGGRLLLTWTRLSTAMSNFAVPAGSVSGALGKTGSTAQTTGTAVGRLTARLGPIGLVGALALATGAIGLNNSRKEDARRLSGEFRDAISDETGALLENADALTRNVDEVIVNELATGDLGDKLVGAEADMRVFTEAVRGSREPLESLHAGLDPNRTATNNLDQVIDNFRQLENMDLEGVSGWPDEIDTADLADELDALIEQYDLSESEVRDLIGQILSLNEAYAGEAEAAENTEAALDNYASTSGEAGDQSGELRAELEAAGVDVEALGEDFDSLSAAVQEYNDALQALFDPQFAMLDALRANEEAAIAVDDAEQALADAIDEHGASSDEAAEAQRNLEDAQRDSARSALDLTSASNSLAAAVEAGEISVEDAEAALDNWVEQGLITRDTANSMGDQFRFAEQRAKGLAGDYDVDVNTPGAEAAKARIDAIRDSVNSIPKVYPISIQVADNSAVATIDRLKGRRRMGGPVQAGEAYLVGEGGPEILISSHDGHVIPNHAITTGRPEQFTTVGGMGMGGGPTVVNNFIATDRMGRAVMESIRTEVREKGRGNVQVALGQGAA